MAHAHAVCTRPSLSSPSGLGTRLMQCRPVTTWAWSSAYKRSAHYLPHSGKLSREKTFANFGQFSSRTSHARNQYMYPVYSVNQRKFSLRNLHARRFAKVFSLETFPLYGIRRILPPFSLVPRPFEGEGRKGPGTH